MRRRDEDLETGLLAGRAGALRHAGAEEGAHPDDGVDLGGCNEEKAPSRRLGSCCTPAREGLQAHHPAAQRVQTRAGRGSTLVRLQHPRRQLPPRRQSLLLPLRAVQSSRQHLLRLHLLWRTRLRQQR